MKRTTIVLLAMALVGVSGVAQQYHEDQQFTYVVPNTDRNVEARVSVEYSEIFDYVTSIKYEFRSLTDDSYEIEYGGAYLRNANEPDIGSTVVARPGTSWSLGSFRFSSNDMSNSASVSVDAPIFRATRRGTSSGDGGSAGGEQQSSGGDTYLGRRASSVSLSGGRGRGSGEVGSGHDVFSIRVSRPGSVSIEVVVTEELEGTRYADDDSMLWLFDSDNRLIAEDDDGGQGYASRITTRVPRAGTYYAVVTTYDNQPRLDGDNRLEGFGDDGGSRIRYDLVVETD